MKKLLILFSLIPALVFAQSYPSPTYNNLTVVGSVTAAGLIGLPNLASQAANTVLANATASSASPAAFSMPGCSTSVSALTWTTSTGFTCNTSINAATLGGATFAAPGAIGATTPGSGAFTTLTASSGLNSTAVGNTTPSTGVFTTLSASSTVSGAGFLTYLASPPAIGGTAAAAGAFTTLSASGNDALLYTNTNGQSISNATATTVTTWTKTFDRVNANLNASTGVFTAPVTGYFQVSAQIVFAAHVGVVNAQYAAILVANSVSVVIGSYYQESTSTQAVAVQVNAVVFLSSGQTLVVQAYQASGGAVALSTAAGQTWISIARIP